MQESISIKKATNGYIVEVACVTLVFNELEELLTDLRVYLGEDKEGLAKLRKKFRVPGLETEPVPWQSKKEGEEQ